MRHVLFVDDDIRLIATFADGVREAGFRTHHCRGPDETLDYLRKNDTAADVIVWDMMLPPGKVFREVDTESGLSTGKHLYSAMRELKPQAYYILLTARGDVTFEEFENPQAKSFVRSKTDLSVEGLADFIKGLYPEA